MEFIKESIAEKAYKNDFSEWWSKVCDENSEERKIQNLMQKSKKHLELLVSKVELSEEMKASTIEVINEITEQLNN